MDQAKQLKEMIILTATYYRFSLSEPILDMYVEDLVDLPTGEVLEAYRAYRKNPRNKSFPLPAQIREMIAPEVTDDSRAKEIASRIRDAVSKYGYSNTTDARAYIGDIGWTIVNRFGGWDYVCQNLGTTLSVDSFYAQARDLAKVQIEFGKAGVLDDRSLLNYDKPRGGGLTSAGNVLKLITTKPEQTEK